MYLCVLALGVVVLAVCMPAHLSDPYSSYIAQLAKMSSCRKRYADINAKLDVLNTLVSPLKLSKQQVLAETVAFVTGKPFHSERFHYSGQKFNAKEYGREKTKHVSKKNAEAYKELKKFIIEKELVNDWITLKHARILEIIIEYLKTASSPVVPRFNHSFSIENLIKKPSNPFADRTNLAPPVCYFMATDAKEGEDENEEVDVVG